MLFTPSGSNAALWARLNIIYLSPSKSSEYMMRHNVTQSRTRCDTCVCWGAVCAMTRKSGWVHGVVSGVTQELSQSGPFRMFTAGGIVYLSAPNRRRIQVNDHTPSYMPTYPLSASTVLY